MKNFINIAQLSKSAFEKLLANAQDFIDQKHKGQRLLKNKFVANLFFEPSTRTRCSFEIAAKKLGAEVINLNVRNSSTEKGETEIDTALNLQAMGVEIFIIRHRENEMVEKIADALGGNNTVINAGSGTLHHPSQAVSDMLTLRQCKTDLNHLTIAIIGDLFHSRVAHSDIAALQLLGVKEIRLIAPENLLAEEVSMKNIVTFTTPEEGLSNVDVIMSLRLQNERMLNNKILNISQFQQQYGLTMQRVKLAKPDVIVMHPGPINRGIEITDAVINSRHAVILQQVSNSIPSRMAILAATCTT